MAKAHGATLDEVEAFGSICQEREERHKDGESVCAKQRQPLWQPASPASTTERVFTDALHLMDHHLQQAKAQRDAALKDAYRRGLDKGVAPARPSAPKRNKPGTGHRLPRKIHAKILLSETQFSIKEVARITGLDVHNVTAIKLQLRKVA